MYNNWDKEFIDKFKCLVKNNNISIDKIEELMIDEFNDYKQHIEKLVEKLVSNEINEQELIIKKNKNGKKKDTY